MAAFIWGFARGIRELLGDCWSGQGRKLKVRSIDKGGMIMERLPLRRPFENFEGNRVRKMGGKYGTTPRCA